MAQDDPACAMSNAHLSNEARGRRVAPYLAGKQISGWQSHPRLGRVRVGPVPLVAI